LTNKVGQGLYNIESKKNILTSIFCKLAPPYLSPSQNQINGFFHLEDEENGFSSVFIEFFGGAGIRISSLVKLKRCNRNFGIAENIFTRLGWSISGDDLGSDSVRSFLNCDSGGEKSGEMARETMRVCSGMTEGFLWGTVSSLGPINAVYHQSTVLTVEDFDYHQVSHLIQKSMKKLNFIQKSFIVFFQRICLPCPTLFVKVYSITHNKLWQLSFSTGALNF
jgi:hypothetical protein